MLKKIRALIIKKKLFSFIYEKQKLKIIKSNKSLQKNLNISIINYIFFSGRYINYDSNGIGKEYNGYNDKLIFEGEYLNGKRNGKGKEYGWNNGNSLFGDEYLNGKGKEYDNYSKLIFIFEGEYLNGERNGKGKEFDDKGTLIFEGEYLNGKRKRI